MTNGKLTVNYSNMYVYIDVGLRKLIQEIFVVADVSLSIIGIDLPQHHYLIIDLRKRWLFDSFTNLSAWGVSFYDWRLCAVKTIHRMDHTYNMIATTVSDRQYYTSHHDGRTVFSEAFWIAFESLGLVESELYSMTDFGNIMPPESFFRKSAQLSHTTKIRRWEQHLQNVCLYSFRATRTLTYAFWFKKRRPNFQRLMACSQVWNLRTAILITA